MTARSLASRYAPFLAIVALQLLLVTLTPSTTTTTLSQTPSNGRQFAPGASQATGGIPSTPPPPGETVPGPGAAAGGGAQGSTAAAQGGASQTGRAAPSGTAPRSGGGVKRANVPRRRGSHQIGRFRGSSRFAHRVGQAQRASDGALALYARGVANEELGHLKAAYADLTQAREMAPGWKLPEEQLARYQVR